MFLSAQFRLWRDVDERVTWKLLDVKGWLSKKALRSREKCGLCALLLKSGRAHRECSRARGKRIQVHPAKLGEAEKRVRSAAHPPRHSPPTLCKLPHCLAETKDR